MKTSGNNIETLLQSGYEFHLGQYLSDGWEIYKRGFWSFAGFTLLFFTIQFSLNLIPFFGTLGSFFITIPLSAGYLLVAHRLEKNENPEFGVFFKGFDFLGPLILLALIQSVAIFALLIPILIIGFSDFSSIIEIFTTSPAEVMFDTDSSFNAVPWMLFLLLPLIYLSMSWRWSTFFILFYDMKPLAALEASRKIITRQFFMFLLFYIIAGLIVASGILLLLVGILFTLPFFYCADYAAFSNITQLNEAHEEDISEHLVE
jgi:uncharacterized membrane protein